MANDINSNNKKNKINVNIMNCGLSLDIQYNSTPLEILERIKKEFPEIKLVDDIVMCLINNEAHSLTHPIDEAGNIKFVSYSEEKGRRIVDRTLKYVFLMAIHTIYPNMEVELITKLSRECFFKVNKEILTEEKINNIKAEMNNIIRKKLKLVKRKVSYNKLKETYKNMNLNSLLCNYRIHLREIYTLYECKEYNYNNFLYGFMCPDTSYIKSFALRRYKNNMCILSLSDPNDINKPAINKDNEKIYERYALSYDKLTKILNLKYVADLNDQILNEKVQDIIRLTEENYNRKLAKVSNDIVNNEKNIQIILLTGPSSSGKTTNAQKLCDQLRLDEKKAYKISMDNYFKDDGEEENPDYESIEHVDLKLFETQMLELLAGKEVSLPTFDFIKSKKVYNGNKLKLNKNDILIIEGIHALNPLVSKNLPQDKIFRIYAAPLVQLGFDNFTKCSSNDFRLLRRIVRDYQIRGLSAEANIMQWQAVRAADEKNIYPFIDLADVIINTSLIYEIGVLKTIASNLLLRITTESPAYSEARRLYEMLSAFRGIETKYVPTTSLLTEFIGGGCFDR